MRFSPMSQMIFYERPDEAQAVLHYSEEEYLAMRIATRLAIEEARTRLRALSSNATAGAAEYAAACGGMVGIENATSPRALQELAARRGRCWDAVLAEQARQRASGEGDEELLARASRRQTEWAAERAHKIGLLQFQSR